jgi:hypothetical protein
MSESIKYDTRVIRHQIRRGVTSSKDFQNHLESLEDCADLAVETETRFDNPYEKRHSALPGEGDAPSEDPTADA